MNPLKTLSFSFVGICAMIPASLFARAAYTPTGVYINAGGGISYYELGSLKGFQTDEEEKEYALAKTSESKAKPTYAGAIGYANETQPFRVELAFSRTGTLDYETDPLFKTGSNEPPVNITALTAKVDSTSAMVVGYADMVSRKRAIFMPYIFAGIGVSSNNIQWTTTNTNPLTGSDRKINLAFQGGAGTRIRLLDNVYLDIKAAYMFYGKSEFIPGTVTKITPIQDIELSHRVEGNISGIQGLLLLTYFFGDQSTPPPSLISDDTI
jgi:opacity protein-like surface antigen